MAEINTGPDAIRKYHTGAAADGNAQADASLCLGNYRASSQVAGLVISPSGGPANVTVDYADVQCGPGSGSVVALSADTLSFTAPGGSAGAAVTIANGETKVLQDGTDLSKYVIVTRTSATALAGTKTLTLSRPANNAVAMPIVSHADSAIGLKRFAAIAIKNGGAVECGNVRAYVRPIVSTKQTTGVAQLSQTTGSGITTNGAQLGASGAGSISSSTPSVFSTWPTNGTAKVVTSGAALREYVRYHKTNLSLAGAPTNVTINFAAQGNGAGTGQFQVNGAGTQVRWQPPSDSAGPWVPLVSGQTRRIPGPAGSDETKSISVTCTGALTASQNTNVTLTSSYTNDRIFVDANGRGLGGTTPAAGANDDQIYRVPGGTVTTAADLDAAGWPASGMVRIEDSSGNLRELVYYSSRTSTALTISEQGRAMLGSAPTAGAGTDQMLPVPPARVAAQAPGSQPTGNFSTISNYAATPASVTGWVTGITPDTGYSIGTLAAGNIYGIWIERELPVGVVRLPQLTQEIGLAFEAA